MEYMCKNVVKILPCGANCFTAVIVFSDCSKMVLDTHFGTYQGARNYFAKKYKIQEN